MEHSVLIPKLHNLSKSLFHRGWPLEKVWLAGKVIVLETNTKDDGVDSKLCSIVQRELGVEAVSSKGKESLEKILVWMRRRPKGQQS